MAKMLLFFLVFASSLSLADKLPKFRRIKGLSAPKAGYGQTITMNFDIPLPTGQKINTGAPSNITIHEKKSDGSWNLIKRINVNEKLLLDGMDINFEEKISLKDNNSQVVVSSTIYHCSLNNKGNCYIDNFQHKFNRTSTGKTIVPIKLYPTMD